MSEKNAVNKHLSDAAKRAAKRIVEYIREYGRWPTNRAALDHIAAIIDEELARENNG